MSFFRANALESHRGGSKPGRPLHIVSTWTRWAVRVTVLAVASGLLFAATAELGEYAQGVAVVRRADRVLVTATHPGIIEEIAVTPGQHVVRGQLLARLDDHSERAEHQRLQREYEERLVEYLREPSNAGLRQRLAALDEAREAAADRLASLAVVAPAEGVVSDLRAQPSQAVTPGDVLVSLERETGGVELIGLFPGHTRPLLVSRESEVILELEGFPDTRREVRISAVADEVIGPAEALRVLGREREGSLALEGPVVVVSVKLDEDSIEVDGERYRLYDGMLGTMEAKLRTATILEHLIPALRRLRGRR